MGERPDVPMDEFMRLAGEIQAPLRAFIRMLGVGPDWVDDVAQETLLVAYRNWAQYDPSQGFDRWARGIARNIVANERRKEGRHSWLLDRYVAERLAEGAPDRPGPEGREILQALNECVEALPEKSRFLLRRRYENDENASELSRRFSLSADAVRQSLMRIRASVLVCMQGKLGALES